jgi:hypothetical protein
MQKYPNHLTTFTQIHKSSNITTLEEKDRCKSSQTILYRKTNLTEVKYAFKETSHIMKYEQQI